MYRCTTGIFISTLMTSLVVITVGCGADQVNSEDSSLERQLGVNSPQLTEPPSIGWRE